MLFLYFTKKYFGQRLCCERFDTFNYAWVYNSIRTRGGVDLLVGRGAVHACLVLVPVARLLVQARPPVSITAVFACTCANISSISVCRTSRTDTQFDSTTLLNRKYCEAQARVRQGSARDGPQGKRPQSLNPCLELTLKLVATTHHPPPPPPPP